MEFKLVQEENPIIELEESIIEKIQEEKNSIISIYGKTTLKIKKYLENKPGTVQFLKFFVIGIANTAIDFGIYSSLTLLTPFFSHHVYAANAISFSIATTFSFFMNRTWTFGQTEKPRMGEALKFYSTTGSGFFLNELQLYLLIHFFGIFHLVAKLLSAFVTIFWNFLFKKFWVFNDNTTEIQTKTV